MKIIFPCFRLFLVLTFLTGIVYPLVVTLLGAVLFQAQAQGSLIRSHDVVVGSRLLAQKTEDPRYFWPRPSADDYGTVASGASNLGPGSDALKKAIADRVAKWKASDAAADGASLPPDLLTASGSGLDPEVSPAGALWQLNRVAHARNFSPDQTAQLQQLVESHVEHPQFGFLGEPRVNVLMLNLALDEIK